MASRMGIGGLGLVLAACGAVLTPAPTLTPTPTAAPTATPLPVVALEEAQAVEDGGFSLRPPVGYDVDFHIGHVSVADVSGQIRISFIGDTRNPRGLTPEEIAEAFLTGLFAAGDGRYTSVSTHTVTVGGVEGLAYELSGTYSGAPVRGRAVIVMADDQHYVFGLGFANLARDPQRWVDQGSRLFDALVETIVLETIEAEP